MLYGKEAARNEILSQVEEFEKRYNKKVVFGSVLGSISKGVERYDSDYDSRFLYFDVTKQEIVRWDTHVHEGGVNEGQIHYCYIPGTPGYYVEGDSYRNSVLKHEAKDKGLFYDKIAFWELTSFLGLLKYPELDGAFSVGLYHTAAWTFNSPYCWDPYGIKERISCLIDKMFVLEYEIQYYRNYILSMQNKDSVMLREYLYAAYYALAMEYCIKNNRFAPVYFKTLLSLCRNEELAKAVLKLEEDYYSFDLSEVESGNYERKMMAQRKTVRNDVIDGFLRQIVDQTQNYEGKMPKSGTDYRGKVVEIILDALN